MTPSELQAIRDRLSYSQKVRKGLPHKVTVTYNACVLSDIAALLAEIERLNRENAELRRGEGRAE